MKDSITEIVQKAIDEKRIVIPSRMPDKHNFLSSDTKESFYNAILTTQTCILKELSTIRELLEDEKKWRIHTEGGFKEE